MMSIRQMSVEEKIKMLPESDKCYLNGFIDRALLECCLQRKGGDSLKTVQLPIKAPD